VAAPGAKTYLMNRIDRLFSGLRNAGRRALVGYLTAGDPDFERSVVNIREALGAGLDVLELGVPSSDPTADGPVIQQASQRALAAGMSVARALDMVREIRRTSDAPIVMFGYANPFFRYGFDRLCADAARSGADGLLAVDVPYEESVELSRAASSAGLHLIRLIAPTTPPDRRGMILRESSGFVYYVMATGVTGAREALAEDAQSQLADLRGRTSLPIAAGFGVSRPEHVRGLRELVDGVVVGSALVSASADGRLGLLVRELKAALE